MPAIIPQLNEDVLREICSRLQPDFTHDPADTDRREHLAQQTENQRTLMSISQANRMCNRAARHALFHSVHLSPSALEYPDLRRRLLALIKQPAIASSVKALHVLLWNARKETSGPPPNSEELTLLRTAVTGLPISDALRARLQQGLNSHDHDGDLTLLLLLTENLHTLNLTIPVSFELTAMSAAFMELALKSGPGISPFSALEEVKLYHRDIYTTPTMFNLMPFLMLPNLCRFACDSFHLESPADSPPSRPSTVREIHFDFGLIEPPGLQSLLEFCPQLETLNIDVGFNATWDKDIYVDYDGLGNAIRTFSPQLRSLVFSNAEENADTEIGSLKNMNSLLNLEIPANGLFPEGTNDHDENMLLNILPTSLRKLKIIGWSSEPGGGSQEIALQRLRESGDFAELEVLLFDEYESQLPTPPIRQQSSR